MIEYVGKKIRNEKGFTVRGLAKAAGIAQSTISKWENSSALPDLDTLDRVAVVLGVDPWHLITYKRSLSTERKKQVG